MSTSTFDSLVADLTRDAHRVQPKDALQFCANWFQTRLEEQRARTRDVLSRRTSSAARDLPAELYSDYPLGADNITGVSPFSVGHRQSLPSHRPSIVPTASPFGTLNVPGNALLSNGPLHNPPPTVQIDPIDPGPSPLRAFPPATYDIRNHRPHPGDFLQPSATILARRTSVSAESILVDGDSLEPLPVYPKTPEQLARIKTAIKSNFIFRDLDEEQAAGVLNAMKEVSVPADEVVIRQGDEGEYFYVVESGLLYCFIKSDGAPPASVKTAERRRSSFKSEDKPSSASKSKDSDKETRADGEEEVAAPIYHPEFGLKVAECPPGTSFGELALMYGHPRAATVLSIEPSTLWRVDRTTFRTIILKAAYRRRTMYEQFLSTVPLLSSLSPEERSKIADALTSKVYADGTAVVKQNELGDAFFLVEEGEAVVTKLADEGERECNRLRKGDYFGELSLLRRAPRAATVSAARRADPSLPKLKVAALDAAAFTRLLGPLREIMERKAGESYGPNYGRIPR